jgi:hypothetical protein
MPRELTPEDMEEIRQRQENTYRKDRETMDLLAEMERMGVRQFKDMFGVEIYNEIKELAADEKRLIPLKQKVRLQAILKHELPMCEVCVNWKGCGVSDTPCPYDNAKYEKKITFEKGELFHDSLPMEVCEKFIWKKSE